MIDKDKGIYIKSVQHAINILECFPNVDTALSLSEISEKTGLKPSTAHGILRTLCANYYVRKGPSRKYLLGYGITRRLKYSTDVNKSILLKTTLGVLQSITRKEGVTTNVYMVEHDGITLVHREIPTTGPYSINIADDRFNMPLYCTASGKLYLASLNVHQLEEYIKSIGEFKQMTSKTLRNADELKKSLSQIRTVGYAMEKEEVAEGIAALARPIYDPYKKLFATISITSVLSHIINSFERLDEILEEEARKISDEVFNN